MLSANLFTCKGTYMTDWVGRLSVSLLMCHRVSLMTSCVSLSHDLVCVWEHHERECMTSLMSWVIECVSSVIECVSSCRCAARHLVDVMSHTHTNHSHLIESMMHDERDSLRCVDMTSCHTHTQIAHISFSLTESTQTHTVSLVMCRRVCVMSSCWCVCVYVCVCHVSYSFSRYAS